MATSRAARTFQRHQLARGVLWVVILLAAFALRAAPIRSALPYLRYVDEGHVLHDAIAMLQRGTFDTGFYNYPALPSYLISGALLLYAPIYGATHGESFWSALQGDRDLAPYYDYIAPREVIVVARVVVLLFSVATVALAGALGRLIGGSRASLLALLLVALCPALVSRSAIVIVDTIATFFALAALYFSQRLQPNVSAPWRFTLAAGAMAGLAFVSKYMAGAVLVAVVVRLAIARRPLGEKAKLIVISLLGFIGASALAMPTLVTNPDGVFGTISKVAAYYDMISYGTSYWRDALSSREIGIPLLLAGCAGLALLLQRSRATRVAAISWLAFAVVLIAALGRSQFQPFRNLLPLVPPFCVAAAFLLARGDLWFRSAAKRRIVNYWIEPAAAFVVLLSLVVPAWWDVERQRAVVDSRVLAVNWLAKHSRPEDRIVAIRDLAIHPAEWRRISRTPTVVSWFEARSAFDGFDYLVSSDFSLQFATDKQAWSDFRDAWIGTIGSLRAAKKFGTVECPVDPGVWRTNDERIVILKP